MLFAGLAKRNPGAIDWTPHVPKMFTRFLHALNLPVAYKDMQITRSHTLGRFYILFYDMARSHVKLQLTSENCNLP